jgi:dihydrofolate synthase / folylpolyglutamate synthase
MGGCQERDTYEQAVEKLFGLQRFGVKLGLEKIVTLLDRLGNPHERFVSSHIAGTNGKGTAAAVCNAVIAAHDIPCGLFTSPHLISLRERVRIGHQAVPGQFIADWVGEHFPFILRHRVTFFEAVTAMAFDYFCRSKVAAAVVEVGLGGRYDATNVINPAVAAITSIGMDHAKYLGASLKAIAAEKAGIAKPGVPLICAERNRKALPAIENTCRETGSPLILLEQAAGISRLRQSPQGIVFNYRGRSFDLKEAGVALYGEHQARNTAVGLLCAEKILEKLGIPAVNEKASAALASVRMPGRFQRHKISESVELILDVAHNPPAARALADVYEKIYGKQRRAVVVAGLGLFKGGAGFLRPLLGVADDFFLPRVDFGRADTGTSQLDPERLGGYLRSHGARATAVRSVAEALDLAIGLAGKRGSPVLVTGSFYLVGDIMRQLGLAV